MTDDTENGSKTGKLRMSPLAWRLLILLFVVALLVFDATRPPSPESWSWDWIGKKLWKMPGGIGALIGTIIGFGALVYATNKGYKNLITTQVHKAELDRQAELDRIEWEQQCLAAGLQGELKSVVHSCRVHAVWLRETAKEMAKYAEGGDFQTAKFRIEPRPIAQCVFFKSTASKIGILGASLAHEVTYSYEKIEGYRRRAEATESVIPATLAELLPSYAVHLEQDIALLEDLIRRLSAIERGEGDPGTDPGLLEKLKTEN